MFTNGEYRVQRGHGILENHGDLGTTYLADLFLVHSQQILTVEESFTSNYFSRGHGNEPQHRKHGYTFTTTAFSNNTQRFSFFQTKGDTVDCMDYAFRRSELRFQPLHIE
ncbi:hypothetical protein SDC9_141317 [bioreactor metagenome]|uniref:Uncharacterized protein n=1 Tax=bioreactor metagenome TaxID=1076179 RepID=A0A645E0R1_9ZZZZ